MGELTNVEASGKDSSPLQKHPDNIAESPKDKALVQIEQIAAIRNAFECVVADESIQDYALRSIAGVVVGIIKTWQERALGRDPVDYALSFGLHGLSITLRQVLTLVPEKYQDKIVLSDHLQIRKGGSWVDESVMNVLVELSATNTAAGAHFARGLFTDAINSWDVLTREEGVFPTRLAYLNDEMKKGATDWNKDGSYTVPSDKDRIVFFWNYYEHHWTVIGIQVKGKSWKYKLHDSLESTSRYTKDSVKTLGIDLCGLICEASDMDKPEKIKVAHQDSAQQANAYDCGVFAVVNALALLRRATPPIKIDPEETRLQFLVQILTALDAGLGGAPKRV
ncbi:uncharacterized protein LY89DRAFT_731243 [Mollisia scopiformis]|uniref:Ubiquitin-like protease family profile domain-containing protein n=1 Tax=Mollisia scopiformis TaxID=149040 RepID=A0A194XIF1_MOLSC|nr:uncharacterized protein LY89DRAFT_731243 [Mollisia scopiformis]KUJ20005.1 hypothetical protein LY89DRAFT_731243 [Mollisia scopiformis]